MSQNAELDRVKARIKALSEKTVANGCTEAEAMAAAEMVGRLLERYALTMGEIDVRAARCVQVEVPIGGRRRRPIDACVPAIARFCDCKVWRSRTASEAVDPAPGRPGHHYVFFGFETDTAMAAYLFAVIDRAIQTETAVFRRAHPKLRAVRLRLASASFQHGMAARVAERLDAMRREREAAVRTRRATGTALMVVKHRVVEDAFREINLRLVPMAAFGARPVASAYHEGWAAGDRVNLNRPVPGDAPACLTRR